jgi:plastocyanin
MKKVLTITAAVCVLGAGGYAFAGSLAQKDVNIRSTGISPRTVTINGGDTVRWINRDTVSHQIVANNGAFSTPTIAPGQARSRRIDTPGTYPYHDSFKPTLRGTVRVVGPAPSVSIGASLPIATFGQQIHVTGVVSPAAANDTVTVWAQPYPQASFLEVGRVQTGPTGQWDLVFSPQILTAFKATWKGKTSAVIQTAIAPQLSLAKIGSWWVVRARAAKSFYARWVYAQRLNAFNQWVSLRKVTLNRQSAQRFKLRLPRGRSLIRVYMTTNQAGAGYVFSASQSIPVRRR